MMTGREEHGEVTRLPELVVMPAPTAWPFVFALGAALLFAGLLSYASLSVLGAVLWILGAVGWFRQVLPHEHHEEIPVAPEAVAAPSPEPVPEVARLRVGAEVPRAWLPLKIYPISAGVKGGLAGGVAMALLAMFYGLIFFRSIWYPINLIAGSLYAAPAIPTMEALMQFHFGWFLFALAMHVTMCLIVGLLYGAMLPMLPTRPIILGGVIGPLLSLPRLLQLLLLPPPLRLLPLLGLLTLRPGRAAFLRVPSSVRRATTRRRRPQPIPAPLRR